MKKYIKSICSLIMVIVCMCSISSISSSAITQEDYSIGSIDDVIKEKFNDDCLIFQCDSNYLVIPTDYNAVLLTEYKQGETYIVRKTRNDLWFIRYIAFENTNGNLTQDNLISMFPKLKMFSPTNKDDVSHFTENGKIALELSVPITFNSIDKDIYDELKELNESQLKYQFDYTIAAASSNDSLTIKGDISGNGKIDLYDAIEIAKYLIKSRDFTDEEFKIADFNDDNKVDLYDAIEIAKTLI